MLAGLLPAAATANGGGTGADGASGDTGVVVADANVSAVAGSTAPQQNITIRKRYDRTPERLGTVELRAAIELPDTIEDFEIRVPDRATLLDSSGFDRSGSTLTWTGETQTPTVRLRVDANRTSDLGREEADVGEWAFIRDVWLSPNWYGTLTDGYRAQESVTTVGPGHSNGGFVFLGEHDVYERDGPQQDFTLVVPSTLDGLSPSEDRALDLLERASREMEVGPTRGHVTAYAAPEPIRGGGLAMGDTFWFGAGSGGNWSAETLIHEYTHTRQLLLPVYDDSNNTEWLTEATAELYEHLYAMRYGAESYTDFRSAWRQQTDFALTERTTWTVDSPGYQYGGTVLAALDYRIRAATGGERSFEDVFRRINDGERVTVERLESVSESVGGRDFDRFFDRYVRSANLPRVPLGPEVYPWLPTATVEGHLGSRSAATSGIVLISSNDELRPQMLPNTTGTGPEYGILDPLSAVGRPAADGSWSVTVANQSIEQEFLPRYRYVYVQSTRQSEGFPADGVADFYPLGRAVGRPGNVSLSTNQRVPTDAAPVSVRVFDAEGEPLKNATVRLGTVRTISGEPTSATISGVTTADGWLEFAGQRTFELSGRTRIQVLGFLRPEEYRYVSPRSLDVTSNQQVRFLLHRKGEPEKRIVGTAFPENVTTYSEVDLTVFYPYLSSDGQVPLWVDGERRTNLTLPHSRSKTVKTLEFAESGTHTVRVGSLPPRRVIVTDPGPTSFTVGDLTLSYFGDTIRPGDEVTVIAQVENIGPNVGQRTVEFTVDGTVVDSETVQLAPNETAEIEFPYTIDGPGDYEFAVGNDTFSRTVTEQTPTPTPPPTPTATETPDAGRTASQQSAGSDGATNASSSEGGADETTPGSGAGFGVLPALVALSLGALWATRRSDRRE